MRASRIDVALIKNDDAPDSRVVQDADQVAPFLARNLIKVPGALGAAAGLAILTANPANAQEQSLPTTPGISVNASAFLESIDTKPPVISQVSSLPDSSVSQSESPAPPSDFLASIKPGITVTTAEFRMTLSPKTIAAPTMQATPPGMSAQTSEAVLVSTPIASTSTEAPALIVLPRWQDGLGGGVTVDTTGFNESLAQVQIAHNNPTAQQWSSSPTPNNASALYTPGQPVQAYSLDVSLAADTTAQDLPRPNIATESDLSDSSDTMLRIGPLRLDRDKSTGELGIANEPDANGQLFKAGPVEVGRHEDGSIGVFYGREVINPGVVSHTPTPGFTPQLTPTPPQPALQATSKIPELPYTPDTVVDGHLDYNPPEGIAGVIVPSDPYGGLRGEVDYGRFARIEEGDRHFIDIIERARIGTPEGFRQFLINRRNNARPDAFGRSRSGATFEGGKPQYHITHWTGPVRGDSVDNLISSMASSEVSVQDVLDRGGNSHPTTPPDAVAWHASSMNPKSTGTEIIADGGPGYNKGVTPERSLTVAQVEGLAYEWALTHLTEDVPFSRTNFISHAEADAMNGVYGYRIDPTQIFMNEALLHRGLPTLVALQQAGITGDWASRVEAGEDLPLPQSPATAAAELVSHPTPPTTSSQTQAELDAKIVDTLWTEYHSGAHEQPLGSNGGPLIDKYTGGFDAEWCVMFQDYISDQVGISFTEDPSRRLTTTDQVEQWAYANPDKAQIFVVNDDSFLQEHYPNAPRVGRDFQITPGSFVFSRAPSRGPGSWHIDAAVAPSADGSVNVIGGNANGTHAVTNYDVPISRVSTVVRLIAPSSEAITTPEAAPAPVAPTLTPAPTTSYTLTAPSPEAPSPTTSASGFSLDGEAISGSELTRRARTGQPLISRSATVVETPASQAAPESTPNPPPTPNATPGAIEQPALAMTPEVAKVYESLANDPDAKRLTPNRRAVYAELITQGKLPHPSVFNAFKDGTPVTKARAVELSKAAGSSQVALDQVFHRLTREQTMLYAALAGFQDDPHNPSDDDELIIASAISGGESNDYVQRVSDFSVGNSYGLVMHHLAEDDALRPLGAYLAAKDKHDTRGFQPWNAYNNRNQPYTVAEAAARQVKPKIVDELERIRQADRITSGQTI